MLLYLRTSKGDINTQNTGNRAGTLIDGTAEHCRWAFPDSLEPYTIRKSQSEFLNHDTGDMLLAVKTSVHDDYITEMHIGIDGSFYQRCGQRVLDVSDIENIVTKAVAKLSSTCPFPVGAAFIVDGDGENNIWFSNSIAGSDHAAQIANLLQNMYSGTTWTTYAAQLKYNINSSVVYTKNYLYLYGVRRTA